MQTTAVIIKEPSSVVTGAARLRPLAEGDVLVDVEWSSISAGTERLLWSGRMPHFPGMGYPLVPGYEAVGRVAESRFPALAKGDSVFVPGSNGFEDVRGLFGASARRIVAAGTRVVPVSDQVGPRGVLLALAATAHHIAPLDGEMPELIVGHGALGRLLARLTCLTGKAAPTVWESVPCRRSGADGYACIDAGEDDRRNYARICDVSGDPAMLDVLLERLAPGGEIILGGFYSQPVRFGFVPAFLREARLRVAAQWQPSDLAAVAALVAAGRLSLDGIITDEACASDVARAYRQAFEDEACLKLAIDWRAIS